MQKTKNNGTKYFGSKKERMKKKQRNKAINKNERYWKSN